MKAAKVSKVTNSQDTVFVAFVSMGEGLPSALIFSKVVRSDSFGVKRFTTKASITSWSSTSCTSWYMPICSVAANGFGGNGGAKFTLTPSGERTQAACVRGWSRNSNTCPGRASILDPMFGVSQSKRLCIRIGKVGWKGRLECLYWHLEEKKLWGQD